MNDYTTTSTHFPVKDITHKPKRMQGDAIRLRESEATDSTPTSNAPTGVSDVPSVITLERAISYYKRMSANETYGKLYSATAKWLEELLVTRTLKTEAAVKAVIEGENKDETAEAVGDTEAE